MFLHLEVYNPSFLHRYILFKLIYFKQIPPLFCSSRVSNEPSLAPSVARILSTVQPLRLTHCDVVMNAGLHGHFSCSVEDKSKQTKIQFIPHCHPFVLTRTTRSC